jgi:hypothetical protein
MELLNENKHDVQLSRIPCHQLVILLKNSTSMFFFISLLFKPMMFARMLEDPSFQPIVSWGPQGDCFVVKVNLIPC